MAESFQLPSCIRGYHVYKDLWNPLLRDQLHCQRERSNDKDRYAIAVVDDGVAVGHLPRKISLVCSLFIKRGGTIVCEVICAKLYVRSRFFFSLTNNFCTEMILERFIFVHSIAVRN